MIQFCYFFRAICFITFAAVKKLDHITEPIRAELSEFEVYIERTMKADTAPMDTIMQYVGETKGKRLRPMLVMLSARLFGEINERTLRAATFVEMIHNATLIHDDVVDDSDQRRGKASVKARWNNATAVLVGDYLLAKAMLLLAHPSDFDLMTEMLRTTAAMSEGELMQNHTVGLSHHGNRHDENQKTKLPLDDNLTTNYLDIITRKTAMLMRACCVGGALSVNATEEQVQRIADFGLHFGMLFQMRDDILDADDKEITAIATKLLPAYLQKTLDALKPFPHSETLEALQELTVFCAEREK